MTTQFRRLIGPPLILLAILAMYLSYGALYEVAAASGMTRDKALVFPVVIDVVTIVMMLIGLRVKSVYAWATLALFGLATIGGNAISVLTSPEGSITVPVAIAVAVHTLPALALLLTVHVAAVTVYSDKHEPKKDRAPRSTPAPTPTFTVTPIAGKTPRLDVTTTPSAAPQRPERAEVVALREQGLSIRQIADATGVAKSTVSRWTSTAAA
jgi:hypothetical protein